MSLTQTPCDMELEIAELKVNLDSAIKDAQGWMTKYRIEKEDCTRLAQELASTVDALRDVELRLARAEGTVRTLLSVLGHVVRSCDGH